MPTNALTEENVLAAVNRFRELASGLGEEQAVRRIEPQLERYRLGLFRLVVVGEIKKGKSSFINALLGEPDLLPALSDVATSTVFKVMYGEQRRYKVFFYPREGEQSPPEPLEISAEQVREYGTEDGNPNNQKRVDFIGVESPTPLLKSGLVIVDTPGLGGLFREHRAITWRYLPQADAVFFVLDSKEAVASAEEMESLRELQQMTPLLFFVQTKIDEADEAQWKKWQGRNLDIIAQHTGVPKERLIYFPVSNDLKLIADRRHSPVHLNRSGFIPVIHFIQNTLQRAKEERLARGVLEQIALESTGIRRRLSDELRVLSTQTKQELDTLEQEFAQAKSRFEQWRNGEYQRALKDFQDKSADLRTDTTNQFQTELNPSPTGPLIYPLIKQLRESELGGAQIAEHSQEVLSSCVNQCSQLIFQIQGRYNDQMRQLISETSQRMGHSFQADGTSVIRGVSVTGGSVNILESGFEDARTAFLGGSIGGTMLATAASFIFPPAGAAVFVAGIIGTIAGSLFAQRDRRLRQKEEALTKLQNLLIDTVRNAQLEANRQFQTIANGFERAARDAFENAVTATQKELAERLEAINAARKRTREENSQKALQLRAKLEQVDKLHHQVGELFGSKQRIAA